MFLKEYSSWFLQWVPFSLPLPVQLLSSPSNLKEHKVGSKVLSPRPSAVAVCLSPPASAAASGQSGNHCAESHLGFNFNLSAAWNKPGESKPSHLRQLVASCCIVCQFYSLCWKIDRGIGLGERNISCQHQWMPLTMPQLAHPVYRVASHVTSQHK